MLSGLGANYRWVGMRFATYLLACFRVCFTFKLSDD